MILFCFEIQISEPDEESIETTLFALFFLSTEFRMCREKHPFFEICQTPELACEVTLMVSCIDIVYALFYGVRPYFNTAQNHALIGGSMLDLEVKRHLEE